MIEGLDVWSGYGDIDWSKVEARFAYARATGYVDQDGTDNKVAENVAGIRAAGIPGGVYHVFHVSQDNEAQWAERLYAAGDGLGTTVGDLPPMLDAEKPDPAAVPQLATMIVGKLERHVEAIEKRFGRLPILYGYRPWYDALGEALMRSETLRACEFWIAAYPFVVGRRVTEADRKPTLPNAWKEKGARIWQYAGDHSFADPGIRSAPWKDGQRPVNIEACEATVQVPGEVAIALSVISRLLLIGVELVFVALAAAWARGAGRT